VLDHLVLLVCTLIQVAFSTMSSLDPQVDSEKTAVIHTKSAESSDDTFLGRPEHKLQRQLKNRHIAMIRFVNHSCTRFMKSYFPNDSVLVVSSALVCFRNFFALAFS
jgi:hypothetical protein